MVVAIKVSNEVLEGEWMEGEFTSGHCISISKDMRRIGKLRRISGLLGKVICLINVEDVYVDQYPSQTASYLGCSYSINKGSNILGQLRVVFLD
ncbi:hypothetical protein TNCV_311271 [Trichonephila clavipes]|nr:hypothetical protein TNCV_311271 [Trichonephila clavipes]